MANAPGRDQVEPMERLIRMVILLSDKGDAGASARQLATVAGYTEKTESSLAALRREVTHLRSGGWNVVNSAADGEDGRYVLHAQDNRLAVLLTPGERLALQQALQDVETDLAPPPAVLAELERAVERHCLTQFTYRTIRRTVHPYTLHSGPSGWMLRGREISNDIVKEFVVTRMTGDVVIGQPGTAEMVETVPHQGLDPMTWLTDPPVDVALSTTHDYVTEVLRVLSGGVVTDHGESGVRISLRVTNRAAFRSRLYELGVRVHVLGPPEMRAEILADLGAVAEPGR
jgi:predicted DNA-binding transcriptional regulator YafY